MTVKVVLEPVKNKKHLVMKRILTVSVILLLVLLSCKTGMKKENSTGEPASGLTFKLEKVWMTDTLLKTPESVFYDSINNMLYVSNINRPAGPGNGFISRVGTDGKIIDLKWITGLKAPKGMAMLDNHIFVADVDELVEIDVVKGEIVQHYPADGASMLNDVAADGMGSVYVSDSDSTFIYRLKNGVLDLWVSEGPDHPNGLYVDGDRILVACDGSSTLKSLDINTKKLTLITSNIGHGDGIANPRIPGYWLVSDWSGEIFMVYPDDHKVSLLNTKSEKINSADIFFMPPEDLVLVPTFFHNTVTAYKLVKSQA